MSPRAFLIGVCSLLAAGAAPAQVGNTAAPNLILDSSDVIDWARVSFSYHWKDQDSILRPYALLKFDLADVPPTAQVLSASLHFYVESTPAGGTIGVYHVADDGWSFLGDAPADLHAWPTDHLIQSYATGTTGWKSIDVTSEVAGEAAGDRVLSLKWEDAYQYLEERIASPSSPDSRHRPYLAVRYVSLLPVGSPDLTLGPGDVLLSDATPAPGQALSVSVTARNDGSLDATNVGVALYDGGPENGVLVGAGTIGSIPRGGGARTLALPWTATAGRHRLTAVLDPGGTIGEQDEANNAAFGDFDVLARYDLFQEDFESAAPRGAGAMVWHGVESGASDWVCDADVPFDPNIGLARQWRCYRTRDESHGGHASLAMYFDGRSDDGTVWVERSIPADPGADLTVDLSWAFGIQSDPATHPVWFVGTYDPEVESDFHLATAQSGWGEFQVSQHVKVPADGHRVWVAVGFTVTWEIEVRHYLDDLTVAVH